MSSVLFTHNVRPSKTSLAPQRYSWYAVAIKINSTSNGYSGYGIGRIAMSKRPANCQQLRCLKQPRRMVLIGTTRCRWHAVMVRNAVRIHSIVSVNGNRSKDGDTCNAGFTYAAEAF